MKISMKLLPMALLVLVGCNNEDLAGGQETAVNAIRASFEQNAAIPRVVIGWDGQTSSTPVLTWSAGDAFDVYYTGAGLTHSTYSTTDGGGTTATFAWNNQGTNPETMSGNSLAGAVFPSGSITSFTGTSLTMTLPATIDDADTKCQLPMYGTAQSASEVSFKHLGGVLRLTINNLPADATSVSIEADKAISGTFTATLSDEFPLLASNSTADANKKLTLNFTAPEEGESKTILVPLLVNTYSSIKVKVGSIQIVNWENKAVERAKIYAAELTYSVIEATTPSGVSQTLSSTTMTEGETTTVNIASGFQSNSTDQTISIPQVQNTQTNLNFVAVPKGTASDTPLKIVSKENDNIVEDVDAAVNTVVIGVAASGDTGSGAYLDITGGKTTFILEETTGSKEVTYESVTALTANNTLIIGPRVIIKSLTIKGGNVAVKGKVETLALEDGVTISSIKVYPGASVTTNNSGVALTYVPGDNNGNEDYTDGGKIEW